jgi:hypothetical protein
LALKSTLTAENLKTRYSLVEEMPKESYAYMGSDDPAPGMGGFSDTAIRRGFIRKVSVIHTKLPVP